MDDGITARVEFAYAAQEPDELTLAVGDIVKHCQQKEDGWMEGVLNGRRGMFPDNFVKLIKKAVPPPPPPSKPKKAAKIVVALFPYTATNRDELSFAEGAQIEFIDHLEEGWATGRLMDTGKTGHYPTNFVEEMKKSQPQLSTSPTPAEQQQQPTRPPQAAASDAKKYQEYQVAFEYKADNGDELDLVVGDTIRVLSKTTADEGWWEGESRKTNKRGVFPKNFLKPDPLPASTSPTVNSASPVPKNAPAASVMIRDPKKKNDLPARPVSEFYPKQENIINNNAAKSRPKGPRNKRPPNPANRRQKAEQGISPIEDNPPPPLDDKEETPLVTPETPKAVPTETTPNKGSGPIGGFQMPGMGAFNMDSLKKKQKQITGGGGPSTAPKEELIPEEPQASAVPEWKKNLLRTRNQSKSVKESTAPSKPDMTPLDVWKSQKKKSSSFRRSTEEAGKQNEQAPWMKEMKDKGKSFVKQEPVEAEYQVPPDTPPVQPAASIRSKDSIRSPHSPSSSASQPSQPFEMPSRPSSYKNPVVAAQRTTSLTKEVTLADLAAELANVRSQVQVLSLRLDEETEKRKALEAKLRQLQK